jgi:outer membrane protein TolC
MKYFLFFTFSVALCQPLFAQQAITPDKMVHASPAIQDKLVDLAMQNPNLEISDHQIQIAKYELKQAKAWWIENISLTFNANEFTVDRLVKGSQPQSTGGYYPYYPVYNVGVRIPIGGFFSKPAATKAAKEKVAIAVADRNLEYRQIRAAVLSAYEDYLANRQLLTLQSQTTESSYNDYLQAKQKFRNGQISVDSYNSSFSEYHAQLTNSINAQHNLEISRIKLEEIIGVPLSTVLNENGSQGTAPADSTTMH